jgi:Phosphorylase superfamily
VYSLALLEQAREAATAQKVHLYEGTYAWYCGPSYETCAEVRAGCRLHYGTFGMSTAPETCMAAALGMHVMAFSLATNLAAGLSDEHLTHEQVQVVAAEATPRFTAFMKLLLTQLRIPDSPHTGCSTSTSTSTSSSSPTTSTPTAASTATTTKTTTTIAVPPTQPLTVGAAGLAAARKTVLAAFSTAAITPAVTSPVCGRAAVCLNPQSGPADIQLAGGVQARLSLAALAPSLCVSPAFRRGELILGTLSSATAAQRQQKEGEEKGKQQQQGTPVLALSMGAAEGFTCEESRFLAVLLRSLGVSRLVLEVNTTSLDNKLAPLGQHSFALDCLDRTTATPALPASAFDTQGRDQLWTDLSPLCASLRDSSK